jgi:hypothetical protein
MAKDSDPLAGAFQTKESGGLLAGLLAEENEFDRRAMWRLGSWGVAAVGAVVIAVMANQAQLGWRRDQVAAADLARHAQQIQVLTKESQNEARRLASAIETLNTDRDRLYSRVTVVEQGLDSVTGAIAKQNATPTPSPQATASRAQDTPAATAPPAPSPSPAAPNVAPVASTPAPSDKPRPEAAKEQGKEQTKEQAPPPLQTAAAASLVPQSQATSAALPTIPLVAAKSIMAPPDPAASKLVQPEKTENAETDKAEKPKAETAPASEVAAAAPVAAPEAAESEPPAPAIAVLQTRFAVDLGSANSIGGLRALWQGLIKSNPELANLRPIIMIRESKTGAGMQLRLAAGPLVNAAAAAKICAGLTENERACETTVFDGQRLSMRGQEAAPQAAPQAETQPAGAKPEKQHRRSYSSKRSKREEPPPPPPPAAPAKPETASSALSSFFSRSRN